MNRLLTKKKIFNAPKPSIKVMTHEGLIDTETGERNTKLQFRVTLFLSLYYLYFLLLQRVISSHSNSDIETSWLELILPAFYRFYLSKLGLKA